MKSSSEECSTENDNSSFEESIPAKPTKMCHRPSKYCHVSLDKKEIFLKCYGEGHTIAKSCDIAGINLNTGKSMLRLYQKDGSMIVKRNRGGRRQSKLTDNIVKQIEELIERNPCITLKKIASKISEEHKVNLSTTSIFHALKSLKITLKNANKNLDRMNSPSTIEQRKVYAIKYSQDAPQARERIVFIDESGFNCHLRRTKARSKINTSAHVIIPTVRGRNISLIAAMNLQGIIHDQVVSKSSVNSTIFINFLEQLFVKLDEANITRAWLVLDNCTIHKTREVQDKVQERNHTIIFLSPYSPMLNPIEKVFSKIKFAAKDLLSDPQCNSNLITIIKQSLATVTSADCNNYYLDMSMKLPLAAVGQQLH